MKKYIGIPVIACVLAAVLGIAFAANRTEEASNAVPASPAVTENTASQLSESTEREPQSGDGPEAELPAPAFTMEEIHTAVFSDVPAGDARGDYISYVGYRGFMDTGSAGQMVSETMPAKRPFSSAQATGSRAYASTLSPSRYSARESPSVSAPCAAKRQRKTASCCRETAAWGEKVVSVVPAAIPACTAHAIAPAQESSSDTSENLPS